MNSKTKNNKYQSISTSMNIHKYLLVSAISLVVFFGLVQGAEAANWYVRPSGGTGSGTSWTAAWNGMDGINWNSVSCGDTIWIAAGTYAQTLTLNKNCASGSTLYVRRARADATECTSSVGWNSSYDSLITQNITSSGGIGIWVSSPNVSNITVSGRKVTNPSTHFGDIYGWKISSASTASFGIHFHTTYDNGSYITFEYLEVQGPTQEPTGDLVGVDLRPDSSMSSIGRFTVSHCKIHGWASGLFTSYAPYYLLEYLDVYDLNGDTSTDHSNLIYIYMADNGILRYSKFHDSLANGTGVVFSDGDSVQCSQGGAGCWANWRIYGNIFHNNMEESGTAISVQRGVAENLKIYNNTFYNNKYNLRFSQPASCGAGSESRNNLIYGAGGSVSCGTNSNNLTASVSSFVDVNGRNFHIVSNIGSGYPRNAGMDLSSGGYFTTPVDMDGTTFGGDGTWDIGAYEYVSDSPPSTYTLNVAKSGTGSGRVTGTGIDCGSDCAETIDTGTGVTLTASPDSDSIFSGWSGGGCSGTGTCTVTMNSNTTVTASFNQSEAPSDRIEAESGAITSPMQIVFDSQASGGNYIQTPTSNSGTSTYTFNIPETGIYKIVARIFATDGGHDSLFFQIDSQAEDTWDFNPSANLDNYKVWREDEVTKRGTGTFDNPQYDPYTLQLAQGIHTLTFRGRETSAKLDYFQFVQTDDTTPPAVPTGLMVN